MKALLIGLVLMLASQPARACPTCETGDTTLTTLGGEQVYGGRLRGAVIVGHRGSTSGGDGGRVSIGEWRTELGVSVGLSRRVALGLLVPFIARDLGFSSGERDDFFALGDPTVLGRFVVWSDRMIQPRHVLGADVGVRVPLAPTRRYASGTPMIAEQQPGSGAFTPIAGIAWQFFQRPWSARFSVVGTWTSTARGGTRTSRSLTLASYAQYAFVDWFSARAGVDVRIDGVARSRGMEDFDSGGAILSAGGDLLFAPLDDLTLLAGVRVPAIDGLRGRQSEEPIVTFALAWDLD